MSHPAAIDVSTVARVHAGLVVQLPHALDAVRLTQVSHHVSALVVPIPRERLVVAHPFTEALVD